jgi:hypothetical protein
VFVAAGAAGEEFFLHPVITLNATAIARTKNSIVFFIFSPINNSFLPQIPVFRQPYYSPHYYFVKLLLLRANGIFPYTLLCIELLQEEKTIKNSKFKMKNCRLSRPWRDYYIVA